LQSYHCPLHTYPSTPDLFALVLRHFPASKGFTGATYRVRRSAPMTPIVDAIKASRSAGEISAIRANTVHGQACRRIFPRFSTRARPGLRDIDVHATPFGISLKRNARCSAANRLFSPSARPPLLGSSPGSLCVRVTSTRRLERGDHLSPCWRITVWAVGYTEIGANDFVRGNTLRVLT